MKKTDISNSRVARYAAYGAAAVIVALLAAWQWELVWRNSFRLLNLDQVENYLMCFGQTMTGRLVPHGNNAAFDFGKLGPMVFYLYSLALLIWKSPLCLIFLSALLNLGAPIILFVFFMRRGHALAGAMAACVMLRLFIFNSLMGETWPHAVLPFAAVCWAVTFVRGIETKSRFHYIGSFLFLSLATNAHIAGFLLFPAGIALLALYRGKIKQSWTEEGFLLFLLPYAMYFVDAWKKDWLPVKVAARAAGALVTGGAGGKKALSFSGHIHEFATNYFHFMNTFVGVAFLIALIFGAVETVRFYRARGNEKEKACEIAPWFFIQCAGLAGVFFASQEDRYFIIYCVGAVASTAILLSRTPFAIKYFILPTAFIVSLVISISNLFGASFNNDDSLFTLHSQVKQLIRDEKFSPTNITRAHAVIKDGTNIGASMEWFTVLTAQYFNKSNHAPDLDADGPHYLFKFCGFSDDDLCRLLNKIYKMNREDRYYLKYQSKIDPDECRICPVEEDGENDADKNACLRTECSYRADLPLSRDLSVYEYYPEMKDLRGAVHISPAVPGEPYEFTASIKGSGETGEERLLIFQTNGKFGRSLRFNGASYEPSGSITRILGNVEEVSYVWFITPAEAGTFSIDWKRKVIENLHSENDVFLDIIDIEIPGGQGKN